jgi:hypothetical protein
MKTKTTISKRQKTLDTLFLQLEIQQWAIRMNREQRREANKIMQIILKTDKK